MPHHLVYDNIIYIMKFATHKRAREGSDRKLLKLSLVFNGIALLGCAFFFVFSLNNESRADVSASTVLPISKGGTSADNVVDARDNLGLGNLATQNGPLSIASGGTNATTAEDALTNLGAYKITSGSYTEKGVTYSYRKRAGIISLSSNAFINTAIASAEAIATLPEELRPAMALYQTGISPTTIYLQPNGIIRMRTGETLSSGALVNISITYVAAIL
ncbi:hypothetical protein FACS189431_4590 [Alphaproteobacteria bacterium]|nr:hypothetical protein FACS189431_4590 [Alphaproteobacteria bacterium]